MATKHLGFIVACIFLAIAQVDGLQTVNGKIKITIGTTSGCSAARRFITQQLTEAYELYSEFLDIEYVPWARTVWHENGTMTCQFNENDCWANRVHRCVLNMLRDNQAAQLHYMRCEFTEPLPAFRNGTYLCAQAVGVRLVDLDYCVSHPGDDLDRAAQIAAVEPIAIINLVPYIVFNDNIDVILDMQARRRLASVICFALAEDPNTGITNCAV